MNSKETLIQFVQEWDSAMVSNNVEVIGRFMSDDWIIVGTEGGITTKSEFLDSIRSGEVWHNRMDNDFTQTRVYGDTGVVTARGTSAGKFKGQEFSLYEWSTSVFVYRNNSWSCVHTMLTAAN